MNSSCLWEQGSPAPRGLEEAARRGRRRCRRARGRKGGGEGGDGRGRGERGLSTLAGVATGAAPAPSASLGWAAQCRAARAPRRTDSGASLTAASPSLGGHHSGARGWGYAERLSPAPPARPLQHRPGAPPSSRLGLPGRARGREHEESAAPPGHSPAPPGAWALQI